MSPKRRTFLRPRDAARAAALFALALSWAPGTAVAAAPGNVSARDGDTIIVDGQAYDLADIKAPPLGRTCRINGHERDCGRIARSALLDLAAAATVTCTPVSAGTTPTFRCKANGYDLSEGMLHFGWAVHRAGAPARYRQVMQQSRAKRHGFWAADNPPPVSADE